MKNSKKTGIYLIINKINGKRYVGSTAAKLGFKRRYAIHMHDLRNNKHHSQYLQRSWNKYGKDAFDFVILEECDSDLCISTEQYWMNLLRPEYNLCKVAGSNLGYKWTNEQKRNRSNHRKGCIPWNKGKKIGNNYKENSFIKRKLTNLKNGTHSGRPPIKLKAINVKTNEEFIFDSVNAATKELKITSIYLRLKDGKLAKDTYKFIRIEAI